MTSSHVNEDLFSIYFFKSSHFNVLLMIFMFLIYVIDFNLFLEDGGENVFK